MHKEFGHFFECWGSHHGDEMYALPYQLRFFAVGSSFLVLALPAELKMFFHTLMANRII